MSAKKNKKVAVTNQIRSDVSAAGVFSYLPVTPAVIQRIEKKLDRALRKKEEPWEWKLTITSTDNGYMLRGNDFRITIEGEDIDAQQRLLWEIIDYFNLRPDRYAEWRVRVTKEHGDKWTRPEGYKEPEED